MSASVDEDICFDVDGTATHGTLRVPAHREGRRLAAALLLPGSGPVDRNGDVPGLNLTPRTLALIAEVLAELGIMSLRFDKYFTGRTGAGAYAQDPGRIDLDAFIRQAAAVYHMLGARPEARPEALLVAGHSEGGLWHAERSILRAPVPPPPSSRRAPSPGCARPASRVRGPGRRRPRGTGGGSGPLTPGPAHARPEPPQDRGRGTQPPYRPPTASAPPRATRSAPLS